MEVGKRLRLLREKAGYSRNYIADRAGISQTHLRRVEQGEADITVGYLRLVCDALGITLKDFFNYNDESEELAEVLSKITPRQKKLLIDFLKSL